MAQRVPGEGLIARASLRRDGFNLLGSRIEMRVSNR